MNSPPAVIPNGIIIFSFGDDNTAKLYGGYALTYSGPAGFSSAFVSPYGTESDLYISVVHFGHRFAACGFDGNEAPISNVSIGGECRNQAGTACVEKYGYQLCSNAVSDLYASTPTYFSSISFIHEIMHSFGSLGVGDHYWTPECTEIMRSGVSARPYQADVFDGNEADYYTNMCPYVFDNFINSYRP